MGGFCVSRLFRGMGSDILCDNSASMNDGTNLNKKPQANPYIEKTEHSAGL